MAKNTAVKQQDRPASSTNQVAVIQPPRLPFHPAVTDRFGVDKAGWKVLCESVWPGARTADAIILALSYCKARRLDPYKRNIHIVPIYDSKKRAEVETVWPGIAELRTTAMRTKGYAGMESPEFGPMKSHKFRDSEKDGDSYKSTETEVSFPEWCRITVKRIVQGNVVSFVGPTVYWLEFYNKKSRYVDAPNEQWRRRPSQMLEKCAEAGALRRAFPEEFGEEYTVEEIGAFGSLATSAKPVDAEVVATTSPVEPKRGDFTEQSNGAADATEVDSDDDEQRDATTAEHDHDPEAGTLTANKNPWKLDASIVGQEPRRKAILDLLELAKVKVDVDEIETEHKDFLEKLGRVKSETMRQFEVRRGELPEHIEAE
ncbi:phage recombination protein Bet [Reyranella massiliensis]|uniref:phage recombination protein Bet n=1 Tax=Reyranella massiliensis TaxID=445220 RepID=UPI0003007B43|nr:phage recombination protein Bet [Reyranella massiliensis]